MRWARRGLAIGIAVAVVAGAGPAQAGTGSGTSELTGPIEPSGKAKVLVSHVMRDGVRYRKYRYRFGPIPLVCDGERHKARSAVAGGEMVQARYADRNPFGVIAISGPFNDPEYKSKVHGRLVDAHTARGYVRVSGSSVPLKGGGSGDCDSGRLHWVARDTSRGGL